MTTEYFDHPNRFPKNAPGPFYSTGHQCRANDAPEAELAWCGNCLQCEAPESEAPELLAPLNDSNIDTYFLRQPNSVDETSHAIMAAHVCCVAAIRYGGHDREIIRRLGNDPELCDYIVDDDDELILTVGSDGELLPFAQAIVNQGRAMRERLQTRRRRKWWQFWNWFRG